MRRNRINILFGGLAGFISVAFVQLLSIPKPLDLSLQIAVILFSFALPLSVFHVVSGNEHLRKKKTKVPRLYEAIAVTTILVGFSGITALFCYFGKPQATIFAVVSILASFYFNKLSDNKKDYFSVIKDKEKKKNKTSSQ